MKVKPLKNHLLVEIVENEESTKSGILLVGNAKGESNIAKIVETADSYDEDQDIMLKGDKIIINPHLGTKVNFNSTEYLIINQKDILAVLM
jgi:chaperonin GroES